MSKKEFELDPLNVKDYLRCISEEDYRDRQRKNSWPGVFVGKKWSEGSSPVMTYWFDTGYKKRIIQQIDYLKDVYMTKCREEYITAQIVKLGALLNEPVKI